MDSRRGRLGFREESSVGKETRKRVFKEKRSKPRGVERFYFGFCARPENSSLPGGSPRKANDRLQTYCNLNKTFPSFHNSSRL